MKASIVIRTKNEEKWINACLNAVFEQDRDDFEVIVVDNGSKDKTIEKVKNYPVRLLTYTDEYRPGKLLNHGIRESRGDVLVCLSGHCIPVNRSWLSTLLKNFDDPKVAGVYGRQEPLSFTPDVDKRDLINTFRLERIVQTKDSFFHNANSAVRRKVWDAYPFDEDVSNIEDRLWAKQVIEKGWKLVYEPLASVYHYHGIHQSNDQQRCSNVVKILENLDVVKKDVLSMKGLSVIALVPVKKDLSLSATRRLINSTMAELRESSLIKGIYVITDDKKLATVAKAAGALIPFLRPKELSTNYVNISDVLKFAVERLEEQGIFADLVVLANVTYPFRPPRFFDTLIKEILESGMDTVIAAHPEYRISWKSNGQGLNQIVDFRPRAFKEPVQVGMLGLGCVTHPFKIRDNEIFSGRVGIYDVKHQLCSFEVRADAEFKIFSKFIKAWEKEKNGLFKPSANEENR